MPPDDVDRILNRLDKFEEKLEPALTQIAVQAEQIKMVDKKIEDYKDKQVPVCEDKFKILFQKFNKVFGLLWGLVVLLLIATLAFSGNLIAKMVTK